MSVQTTWRYGLIAVGVMLCAWKFISGTLAAEDIRQNGERILIELRPVDPRSLFLGDYIALNYDREALPEKTIEDKGFVVIRLDGDGIVKFVRLAGEAETLAENERLIRYRRTSARWGGYTYGGARYYFQSGTAERYADAQYGEFRLMPDGWTLLSGLAGEDKVTIHTAGDGPKKETVE